MLYFVDESGASPLVDGSSRVWYAVAADEARERVVALSRQDDGPSTLAAVDVDSGESVVLAEAGPEEMFWDLAVSSDGSIAVTTQRADGPDGVRFLSPEGRWLSDIDADRLEVELQFACSGLAPGKVTLAGWRPGAVEELLVMVSREGCEASHSDVHALTPDGGVRRLTSMGTVHGAAWTSVDGDLTVEYDDFVYRLRGGQEPPVDVGGLERLAVGREIAGAAGGRVAMVRAEDRENELSYGIAVSTVDGDDVAAPMRVPGRQARLPRWTDDGTVLFVASTPDAGAELYELSPGGQPRRLTDLGLWITSVDGWGAS